MIIGKKTLVFGLVSAISAACSPNDDVLTLFVGTYTGSGSEGIYVYQFDQETGGFVSGEAVGFTEIENPSFLTVSDDDVVYAVSEKSDESASIHSFRYCPEEFSFDFLGKVSSMGADPCYVSTDGRIAASGNYSGGTMAVFPIGDDGALMDASVVLKGSVGGPDLSRQNEAHVHCAVFSPDGRCLIATDFSADRLIKYEIGSGETEYFPLAADSGPRHVTFSPDGRFLYVIGELSGDVSVLDYEGGCVLKQVVNADRVDARGAADIHISPDGRFLYTSLRVENDGIAIFGIAGDGTLTEAGYMNTGRHPRNFTITPNGRFLLCACRDSDSVDVYEIDPDAGLLTETGRSIRLSKPVCLVWHK